ncbi:DUF6443 domain-containing protein [Mucilaginibacter sp. 22184]|uniref:DUF6443 domain-containing protein n=1 Tax=Mucilaginibacter sp. 22184 TaxID=3453887 RepID=UPI003F843F76
MRRHFKFSILSALILSAGPVAYSQTTPPGATAAQNYVATFMPRAAGMTTNTALNTNASDKNKVATTIQYFDGLGRPLQTVQRQASPQGNDIVQPFAYDQFGREAVKYLPYVPQTGTAGSYKADALTTGAGQSQFYATPPAGVTAISNPFSITNFEPSPLNRVIEQGAPGIDWQPAAGHTQKIAYTTNNIKDITDTANTMLAALYTTTINANGSRTLAKSSNYGAGQLYVTVSKDENWKSGRGGTTEEYKDKEGHVVLKRTFNYIPAKSNPAVAATLQILSTYYVYDDLGNLAFVLPPRALADIALPSTVLLNNLCYQYRYDERNRLTQKKIPGKGWEFTVYNRLDQPVLTQDSLQRQSNQWTVTKYDALGRVIMTGLWNAGTVYALSTLQNNIYGVTQWDTRDQTNNTTTYPTGYVLGSYPVLTKRLTINYYDDYNIPNLPAGYLVTNGVSTMTKGLLTASLTTVLNTIANDKPDTLWEVSYYDDKGRNIRSYKQHYLGGTVNAGNFDVVLNTYNFNDQVTSINRRHFTTATGGTPKLTIINEYMYDHMGRRTKVWEKIQNGGQAADIRTLIAQTAYNEVGQVWKKNLHSTDSTNFKQTVTYGYNERGWLNTSSAPLFAEQLYYNTNSSKQYNGNIAYQYWGTPGSLTKNYAYVYDQLNRLTAAAASTGNHENNITYDPLGNITGLNRYQGGTLIDQLTYTYPTGSSQLQAVTDATTNNAGQKSGIASYAYDGNGNLISDNSKGISNIAYNLLNLPQTITGKSTTYTYDAIGQKLSRLINTAKTDYIGGIQYDGTAASSTISFIQTEEGRALPKDATSYNYEYTLTDHLGNSRVSFDTGTGTARQVQVDDYYPFGMEISTSVASPKNEYLYNKKELQENLGLYDYGARFYDPVIARWTSIDPKSQLLEIVSPYIYSLNNPVNFIDRDGELPIFINGRVFGGDSERGNASYWDAQLLRTIASSGIPNPGGTSFYVDGDRYMYNFGSTHEVRNAGWLEGGGVPEKRRDAGREIGKEDFEKILAQLARDPKTGKITEKIQIYTHSRGAAFGAGYTEALLEMIKQHADEFADAENEIDFVYNMGPHQSWGVSDPKGVDAYSDHHDKDFLSGNSMGGVKAHFASKETSGGVFGPHSTTSFIKDVGAFLKAFKNSKGDPKKVIDDFVKRMKKDYNIQVTVKE